MDINFGPLSGMPIPAARSASSCVCGAGPAIIFNLQESEKAQRKNNDNKLSLCIELSVLSCSLFMYYVYMQFPPKVDEKRCKLASSFIFSCVFYKGPPCLLTAMYHV